ncbi:DUF2179 domain-containing protein [Fusibacter paucivorans]|uniref:UPF0316 protein KHM83_12540 n=1 Tax=Fusibacter paucivorans TaxID=76009 RepID=A0ABS5PQS2_9FIRM|nr:DUF2179 domain-containing protein [Fusibacter paucivorans]MBS7527504.1 DUF2179 domain-containing protein [Fusibacter paucivorans]
MKELALILILQLCYVPMLALRTISMVKKMTLLTSVFGIIECLIYVFGLSLVLTGNQTFWGLIVYALGYGLGLIVGIHVEDRLAIGYTSAIVNIRNKNEELIKFLRDTGFGVTIFEGEGRESTRYRLDILTKRNRESELLAIIEKFEPSAFVIFYEPKHFKGGYILSLMKRKRI